MKAKDLVFKLIKAKYSNNVAKATKTLKQIMHIIQQNKNLTKQQKKQLKQTFNKIYFTVYKNTKSHAIAQAYITALAFKLNILHNKNYKNTYNYKHMQNILNTFKHV